jgi:curved DNA-binding protein
MQGQDQEAEITIPLEEAYRGTKRGVTLESRDASSGRPTGEAKTLEVKIPAGTTDGQRLRLRGQGAPVAGGGTPGDLYLRIRIAPHPIYRLNGSDLELDAPVTPWEAALGSRIEVPIIGGKASVKLQPGTQSGRRLRLRGKGFPYRGAEAPECPGTAVVRGVIQGLRVSAAALVDSCWHVAKILPIKKLVITI